MKSKYEVGQIVMKIQDKRPVFLRISKIGLDTPNGEAVLVEEREGYIPIYDIWTKEQIMIFFEK